MQRASTVLIVDDDGELARMLSRTAKAAGLSTIYLPDGDKVLEVAVAEQPDAILLDVLLPHGDGRDVLRALKAHPRTFCIPVFVHTGMCSHVDRLAALQQGADDYFEKPFDPTMLVRRIVRRIAKFRADAEGTPPNEADRRSSSKLRIERSERLSQGHIRVGSSRQYQPVLVVEDDNDLRACICDILEDEGIEAWPARNGREALDLLHRSPHHPSLILLDLSMPIMDGLEFHQRLALDATIPPTPVIVMSEVGPGPSMVSLPWLQKPINLVDLLSAVHQAAG